MHAKLTTRGFVNIKAYDTTFGTKLMACGLLYTKLLGCIFEHAKLIAFGLVHALLYDMSECIKSLHLA